MYRGEISPWRVARLADCLPPESRVRRGDSINATWMSYSEQLLALAVNHLRILAWQNTKDGQKGRNIPEPILLPEQQIKKAEDHIRNTEKARRLRDRLRQREVARNG